MVRSGQVTWPDWPSKKCGGQRAVASARTMNKNASLQKRKCSIPGLGYDRATGRWFADVGSNEPIGYERFNMPFGNDDFPSMYSQSLTCSRIMYAHHDLLVRQTVGRIQQIEEKEGKPARG
ncbi:retrotransposon protein [Cucumis melo var. makuwa]|uniref:Retrotransposon protein n=1 Tax=Cucumis melo var. makuwa TaxID=1194695 RepID=A0A5A7VLG5_CUCMM|nr:retrotransposon protein [Cucumis melo var. makuwa]